MNALLNESRAEVSTLIDTLERFVLTTNLRGVRTTCKELEAKFTNKTILPLVLELGAVQALLGALNQSRRDLQVTETVFSSLLAIGSRPTLIMAGNQDLAVSVTLLLRPEGLLAVCRAANEHRANVKVLALALRLFANCCRDEQGSRMVVFSPVFQFLLEVVNRYRSHRDLVSLALFTVSYCTVFHYEARALVAKGGVKSEMYTLCREYANEVDILEPSMCIFCMISGDPRLIAKQDELDEIGSIALHALNVFALRTFDEVNAAAAAAGGGIVGSTFQNFASRFSTTTTTTTPTKASASPVPIVTSSNERRCSSWCLLLLSNLAKANDEVRNQVIQSIVQAGVAETEVRYQRILESLLASCLGDVVSNKEDEEDFMTFSEEDKATSTAATFDFLLTGSEEDLIAKVLFSTDPSKLLLQAQRELQVELGKTLVSPVSLLGTRLFTLVFAMLQHPLTRRKLSSESISSIAHQLLPSVKARSGENGEYFTQLARQLEQKLATPMDHHMVWIPYRAFPLLVDKNRLEELEQMDFTFSLWRTNPKSLCHQITLKMESLYAVVDPTICCATQQENEQNAKLLAFHRNLQIAIKGELLSKTQDEESRAGLIECIIDVASYSATSIVGNLDLTMLCLTLLHSKEVQHLKLTWKRVRDVYKKVLRELVTLSAFEDLATMDFTMKPPPLLQSPRIPYLEGFLRVMTQVGDEEQQYACFNWWFPNLGKNGDWYSRAAQFTPQPNVQIALSAIANMRDEEEDEEDMLSLAKRLEPDWLIEQGESHDALLLQVQIEQLVDGLDALKAWQKRPQQLSLEQSGKLVALLMDELVVKKKLVGRTLTAQICLERIVLALQSSRLFLLAVQSTAVEETEFQSKLSKIKLQREEEWLLALDIAPRFATVPWRGAIAVLNVWICAPTVFPPSQSMGMLLKFKDELFLEAQQHGLKHLTAEDLIPIVIVALVRSNVLNFFLCSHLHFIKTFLGDDELAKQGESLYYLVTLESAVYQIRKM